MLKRFFTIFSLISCCIPGFAEPMVKIPRITPEKAADLSAADIFCEDDWAGAAVVRTFSGLNGKKTIPASFPKIP